MSISQEPHFVIAPRYVILVQNLINVLNKTTFYNNVMHFLINLLTTHYYITNTSVYTVVLIIVNNLLTYKKANSYFIRDGTLILYSAFHMSKVTQSASCKGRGFSFTP